jgi:hypothetical protein
MNLLYLLFFISVICLYEFFGVVNSTDIRNKAFRNRSSLFKAQKKTNIQQASDDEFDGVTEDGKFTLQGSTRSGFSKLVPVSDSDDEPDGYEPDPDEQNAELNPLEGRKMVEPIGYDSTGLNFRSLPDREREKRPVHSDENFNDENQFIKNSDPVSPEEGEEQKIEDGEQSEEQSAPVIGQTEIEDNQVKENSADRKNEATGYILLHSSFFF